MSAFRSAYRSFGAFYARSFAQRPWLTLAVANGTLGVIADSLAQGLEHTQATRKEGESASKEQGWDYARSGRFLAFGVGMAPLLAEWNKFIEYRFPLRASGAAGTAGTASTGAAAGAAGAARAGAAASAAATTAGTLGRVSLLALGKRVAFDQILLCVFSAAAAGTSRVHG